MKAIEKLIKAAKMRRFGENWVAIGNAADDEFLQETHEFLGLEQDLEEYEKEMPCGHQARYAYTADEGTSFCTLCELEGRTISFLSIRGVPQTIIGEDTVGGWKNVGEGQKYKYVVPILLVADAKP